MKNISRRNFIRLLPFFIPAAMFFSTTKSGLGNDNAAQEISDEELKYVSSLSSDEKKSMRVMYDFWINNNLGSPEVHIRNRLIELNMPFSLNKNIIKIVSRQDFYEGALINVNGLILSLFECAVISSYAKKLA